ncbi:P-loop containing nucleoside triphosphate hydrolase protein [Fomitopsis serialis]|uniref:P-loop containing nucleoside triphosphate hydrolase protein n=1 Tax=Fomitopsis serialis TaxID=139415 RepID=UPI0020087674|nr:P-loop containing nucleoside triphosphate hydrolase protein [Neoantrodia serialis]KAH9915137.1 P-loop containing nucleoside triphosphate hydrolase protein [Neoantrodia serialis]
MKNAFKWSEGPRQFQLEGVRAQLEGTDTIIQAPTGSGKTAIAAGPYVWPGNAEKTTIMVSPLLALEEEMVGTFQTEFGLPAVAVNSQSDPQKLREIIKGILQAQYRIILISPEMLQSRMFKDRVLRNQKFTSRVLSIVLDEAHCLSHWGANFRKHYNSLGTVRAFLPPGTPIIAVTATLTARVRRDLHSKLHFPKLGSKFINIGNDRPNVSIVVRACEHPQNTFADLDFVLPTSISSPQDIPKTYVYVENIETGNDIIDHLEALLQTRNPSLANSGLIRPFNATMSPEYRNAAMAAFRDNSNFSSNSDEDIGREHHQNQPIRILVCTDAAGMGCNVPDIDLVVQWKLPAKLSNFIQRAGRAARGRGRTGLAILLVERSAYSTDIQSSIDSPLEEPQARQKPVSRVAKSRGTRGRNVKSTSKKAAKGYAELHGVNRGNSTGNADGPLNPRDQPHLDREGEDEGLLAFVQSTRCRRGVWRDMYECPPQVPVCDSTTPGSQRTVPCCDLCDPTLFARTRPPRLTRPAKAVSQTYGLSHPKAQSALEQWRSTTLARDYPQAIFGASALLDDAIIEKLTSVGPVTPTQAKEMLKGWLWRDDYEGELSDLLCSLNIPFYPKPKPPKKPRATQKSATMKPATKRAAPEVNTAVVTGESPQADSDARPLKRQRPVANVSRHESITGEHTDRDSHLDSCNRT